jgi:VWFA-related protein
MKLTAVALILAMQQSPFTEVLEVRIHNVDVIVTDAKGNHVGGLRQEDFEVFEDGKPQALTNFAEYVDRNVAAPAVAAAPAAAEPARAETPAAGQTPPPRKFVVFVDDMTIHPYTRKKFTKSVSDLVARTIREGDVVSVVRPTTPDKVELTFKGDRSAIMQDIKDVMDASRHRTDNALALEARDMSIRCQAADTGTVSSRRAAARCRAAAVRKRVEQRLGNLRALVAALGEEEGRKIVIVVTDSLPAKPGEEFFRSGVLSSGQSAEVAPASFNEALMTKTFDYLDLSNVLAEIARSASATGITIYCLQPDLNIAISAPGDAGEGARVVDPVAEAIIPAEFTGEEQPVSHFARVTQALDALRGTEQTFDILTEKTGGKWFRGDTRVDDAFRQVELDVTSYYSMAYRAEGSLDKPHRIDVRVKGRPELNVRARNEVTRRSIKNEVTERVVGSLVQNDSKNDLGIAVETKDVEKSRRDAVAKVDVLVPLGKLTFLPEGDMQKARFTVHYAVSGELVDFVTGVEPEQVVEIPAAEFEAARSKHWRYTLTMNMRKAAHRVGVGVLDATSQEWGVATVDVDTR